MSIEQFDIVSFNPNFINVAVHIYVTQCKCVHFDEQGILNYDIKSSYCVCFDVFPHYVFFSELYVVTKYKIMLLFLKFPLKFAIF